LKGVNPAADMSAQTGSSLAQLAAFLDRLAQAEIYFTLSSVREGAIMVLAAVPGERWEIEFFHDRPMEVEVFRSVDGIGSEEVVERLFDQHRAPFGAEA
jgi:hypothetical protein